MKICQNCREEFLEHVEYCTDCDEKLVSNVGEVSVSTPATMLSKEELLKGETVALLEGALESCRELEKILVKSNISAVVYPVKLGCDDNAATLGASCSVKYMVLVRVEDVDRCKEALEGRFHEQVAREGLGRFVQDSVDISQSEISCPACEQRGALKNGECSSCGLFLGAA